MEKIEKNPFFLFQPGWRCVKAYKVPTDSERFPEEFTDIYNHRFIQVSADEIWYYMPTDGYDCKFIFERVIQ